MILLSTGKMVKTRDPSELLALQLKILLKLSRTYPKDELIQNACADANLIGLEISDLLQEQS